MTAVDYLGIAGPEDECAKHGKAHMVYLRNLKSSLRDGNGFRLPHSELDDGTWVCRACTGEEYFKELSEAQDETI